MGQQITYILITLVIIYGLVCAFYYFFQSSLIFAPCGKLAEDAPIILASPIEEVFFDTPQQGRIHAILIKAKVSRGCILYFHGNTGGVLRWGPIAEELTSFGFDVFLPDYRGYGKSRGKRSEQALFSDAQACYQEVLLRYPAEKVCIYGRSLGSGMASWLASHSTPAAVVLETPYDSLTNVALFHSKVIPVNLFLRYSFRNDIYLRAAKSPILIAHGTKDTIVPYKLGLNLYKIIGDRPDCEMLTIPGGKHGNLNGYPVMRVSLQRFFDRWFGPMEKF